MNKRGEGKLQRTAPVDFGARLASVCAARGEHPAAVSVRLRWPRYKVPRLARAAVQPTLEDVRALARALHVSPAWLAFGSETG